MNNNYYNEFVKLSLKQCKKNDYVDKQKVKVHNEATRKLKHLQAKMEEVDCTAVLSRLLCHEDDRVKINAALQCLQMNILSDRAVPIIRKIIISSDDPTICFSAKMILQIFQHSS